MGTGHNHSGSSTSHLWLTPLFANPTSFRSIIEEFAAAFNLPHVASSGSNHGGICMASQQKDKVDNLRKLPSECEYSTGHVNTTNTGGAVALCNDNIEFGDTYNNTGSSSSAEASSGTSSYSGALCKSRQLPLHETIIVGVDSYGKNFTDILGAGIAAYAGIGYVALGTRSHNSTSTCHTEKQNKTQKPTATRTRSRSSSRTDSSNNTESSTKERNQDVNLSFVSASTENEIKVEYFFDEVSLQEKAIYVERKLIQNRRVVVCSAWVDSRDYLVAAINLLQKCNASVVGIGSIRFEENDSTRCLLENFHVYAKSLPKNTPKVDLSRMKDINLDIPNRKDLNCNVSKLNIKEGMLTVAAAFGPGFSNVDDEGTYESSSKGLISLREDNHYRSIVTPDKDDKFELTFSDGTSAMSIIHNNPNPHRLHRHQMIKSKSEVFPVAEAASDDRELELHDIEKTIVSPDLQNSQQQAQQGAVLKVPTKSVLKYPKKTQQFLKIDSILEQNDSLGASNRMFHDNTVYHIDSCKNGIMIANNGVTPDSLFSANVRIRRSPRLADWEVEGKIFFNKTELSLSSSKRRKSQPQFLKVQEFCDEMYSDSTRNTTTGTSTSAGKKRKVQKATITANPNQTSGNSTEKDKVADHSESHGSNNNSINSRSNSGTKRKSGTVDSFRPPVPKRRHSTGGEITIPVSVNNDAASQRQSDYTNTSNTTEKKGHSKPSSKVGVTFSFDNSELIDIDGTRTKIQNSTFGSPALKTSNHNEKVPLIGRGETANQFSSIARSPRSTRSTRSSLCCSASSTAVLSHTTSVYEANNPSEDRHAYKIMNRSGVHLYGVFDGHGGSKASQFCSMYLLDIIFSKVDDSAPSNKKKKSSEEIVEALKESFVECDQRFLSTLTTGLKPEQAKGIWNAGSCAIVALVKDGLLYIAHTGDCRAVVGTTKRIDEVMSPCGTLIGKKHASPSPKKYKLNKATAAAEKQRKKILPYPINAVPLSRDHNCLNEAEIEAIKKRSTDKTPIRYSSRDLSMKSKYSILRVAGSLAVTRALGDAYLKEPSLSFEPYKKHLPYITAEAEVEVYPLDAGHDKFFVLATDGVWERLSNEEVVEWVSIFDANIGKYSATASISTASEFLIEKVLNKTASMHPFSIQELKNLPKGASRRSYHDDICATVVHLKPPIVNMTNPQCDSSAASIDDNTVATTVDYNTECCVTSAATTSIYTASTIKGRVSKIVVV